MIMTIRSSFANKSSYTCQIQHQNKYNKLSVLSEQPNPSHGISPDLRMWCILSLFTKTPVKPVEPNPYGSNLGFCPRDSGPMVLH